VIRERVSGWGRTNPALVEMIRPDDEANVVEILATAPGVIARGLGRSYGDAAQLSGGLVLDNRSLTGISAIDSQGHVHVGAGVSFDELLTEVMPRGWFVPVTPGTRQVTMGGAVAADVHGKNHHVDGSFGNFVTALRLVTPTGVHNVSATSDPELFWATVGGMGLTGVITQITLSLVKIATSRVAVDTDRFRSLPDVMDVMRASDDHYNFSVAWVDCMAAGSQRGRSVLERANFDVPANDSIESIDGPTSAALFVPFTAPNALLNAASIRAFNELWFRKSPRHAVGTRRPVTTYFYPLDGVRDWNKLYGRRGFVQYQCVVPDSAHDVVVEVIDRLSASKVPSFFAVLKRMGPANEGLLSFPLAGWTLALDLPLGPPTLPAILDELDALVVSAKGRVYLAKDARVDRQQIEQMYPRIDEFRRVKQRVDPLNVMVSDLSRRLNLGGK
jgi:decaprenylphospho-beta-D-ribofuranose 2-oxidase